VLSPAYTSAAAAAAGDDDDDGAEITWPTT